MADKGEEGVRVLDLEGWDVVGSFNERRRWPGRGYAVRVRSLLGGWPQTEEAAAGINQSLGWYQHSSATTFFSIEDDGTVTVAASSLTSLKSTLRGLAFCEAAGPIDPVRFRYP